MTPFDATLHVPDIEERVRELRHRVMALRDVDWPVRQRDWSRDFDEVTTELDTWTHVLAQLPDEPPEVLYRYDSREFRDLFSNRVTTRQVSVSGIPYYHEATE